MVHAGGRLRRNHILQHLAWGKGSAAVRRGPSHSRYGVANVDCVGRLRVQVPEGRPG